MNKELENKLTMYEAVSTLLGNNESIVTTVPAFVALKNDFTARVQEIHRKAIAKRDATAGKTETKQEAKDSLVSALMAIAAPMYTYARKVKNNEVKDIADVRQSKLEKLRDTELVSRATSIHTQANTIGAALEPYGVTIAMITDLDTKINNFNAALGERESGMAIRSGATTALIDLFNAADELLNEDMDRLIETLRVSNTDFYNEYFAARVIKDIGVRHEPVTPTPPPPTP
jgi:hypothetical protein